MPLDQCLAHSTQYLLNEWGNEDQVGTGKPEKMKSWSHLKVQLVNHNINKNELMSNVSYSTF